MRKALAAFVICAALGPVSFALAQSSPDLSIKDLTTTEVLNVLKRSSVAEVSKLATYLIFLGLGWLIGKRLTVLWSRSQKENEQDLMAGREFHAQYGEFFALWKLWNYFRRDVGAETLPGSSRWDLLDRACKAEGEGGVYVRTVGV